MGAWMKQGTRPSHWKQDFQITWQNSWATTVTIETRKTTTTTTQPQEELFQLLKRKRGGEWGNAHKSTLGKIKDSSAKINAILDIHKKKHVKITFLTI